MTLATIPEAIAELQAGRPVLVADDERRENEGDVIMAAQFATQEWIAWIVRNTSGYLCAPMLPHVADRLSLPLMTARNQDPHGTAYTITVDAANRKSTGIAASERANTFRVLADPNSTSASLIRPGHVLPLRARPGGVLVRPGHTEAATDLMQLAGLEPVGVIAEMVKDDGEMMRLPDLFEVGERENITVITIKDLAEWLRNNELADPEHTQHRVEFEVETRLPTVYGEFTVRGYRDMQTNATHLALVSTTLPAGEPIVRVHSECLTGEVLGSLRCECGPQLAESLRMIAQHGGIVIYLRGHEGRGIGLVEKLHAYNLQDSGLDTLDANLARGHGADEREYGGAAAILRDLGALRIRLLTNNPDKVAGLEQYGLTVSERLPLVVGVVAANQGYLDTKRERMGHILP